MRSKSYLFLVVVLFLAGLSAFGFYKLPLRKGLDISGGVRFTYQMDTSKLPKEEKLNLKTIQERLVGILQNRAVGPLGVTEPVVTAKGEDQIVVELPGFSDVSKAQEVMGTSARIEMYWAKNVATERNANRPYDATDVKDPKEIGVEFRRKFGGTTNIKYGDPEYAQIVKGWELILAGDDLKRASPISGPAGFIPGLEFSIKGAEKLKEWSTIHVNQREQIAFVLDGKVVSIAPVEDNAILEYQAQITGAFPDGYVKNLTDLLNSGALPVDLKLQSSETVDPTIGKTAFDQMIVAGIASFALTAIYLLAYYSFAGFVAFLALCLYVLLTLTTMKLVGATFSLAGIAGFILSVGMAVDANILVFERFKEEMANGKSLMSAIELGFRRALPAIIDSNACTILTSLVLANLGTGPVKGFATTLIIGVAISLFTAVTVTRSLLVFFVGSGIVSNPKWFAVERNWFGKFLEERSEPLAVVTKSKKWFLISLISIIVPSIFFFFGGFKLNVEFRGGYEAVFATKDAQISQPKIAESLEKAGLKGGNVKLASAGAERLVYVTLPPLEQFKDKSPDENVKAIATAAGLSAADSKGFTEIGPAIQKETTQNAVVGVLGSCILIVLYLAFRFGMGVGGFVAGLRFALSAIGALVHDIFVVFGLAAMMGFIFGWEVSALFLTAMLTIIGFSVHDTIVIFDRIRENLHKPLKGEEFGHLVNRSITQSFARSINTSLTVIATLGILVAVGTATPDLKFFVATMLVGILSGTYSSIYNASPILYLWDRAAEKKHGRAGTLVGMALDDIERVRMVTSAPDVVASPTVGEGGRTYGQVRRRANQPKKGNIELDD